MNNIFCKKKENDKMQKEFFKRNKSRESRKRLSLTGNIWKFSIWFIIIIIIGFQKWVMNPEMSDIIFSTLHQKYEKENDNYFS